MIKSTKTTLRLVTRTEKDAPAQAKRIIDVVDFKGTNAPVDEVDDELDADDTEEEGSNYDTRGGIYYLDLEEEAEGMKTDGRYTIAEY